ncbi:MAG: selenium metabolism-associated LysR family transcriptional regulator [Syntrophales bacterium]|nr:selenium metabolism-associated LysR family transcriptional regulator [Syntrophales bacterium]
MNLNQLWIFYNVAKHKSFSAAAAALFLTQPATSTQVKLLENYYDVKLFDRHGQKIQLTDPGLTLFDYAEKLFTISNEADLFLKDVQGLKSGTLRINASRTLGVYYLPDIINEYTAKYRNISVIMDLNNSEDVRKHILDFKADIGFLASADETEKLVYRPFIKENMVLIVSPKHELAQQKSVKLSRLNGQSFIMREKGSGTRTAIEELFRKKDINVKVLMELASNEAIKRSVENGLGISIVSANIVRREAQLGVLKLIRLRDEDLLRNFYIVYHRDKYLSKNIQMFLETASNYSKEYMIANQDISET